MRRYGPLLLLVLVVALASAIVGGARALGGAQRSQEATSIQPARVGRAPAGGFATVSLTRDAARRLDVRTARVRSVAPSRTQASAGARPRPVIPYAALLYDAQGATYAYVRLKPLTYVRQRIVVSGIRGQSVFLAAGLRPGVSVVTVGAAELLGAETGAGDEG